MTGPKDETHPLNAGAAWMDGRVIPISQARIQVNDWGLIHSDITYDVVPVWDGGFFRLDDYLERFAASRASLSARRSCSASLTTNIFARKRSKNSGVATLKSTTSG